MRPAQRLSQGDERERGTPYLDGNVCQGEHQPALAEGFWYCHRHEKAGKHHCYQHQANRQPIWVEPVGEPGCVDPHPPHHQKQHQGFQHSSEAQVLQQPVGELRHSEDVDQIEEQLQGCNPLLTTVPSSKRTSVIGDVHHIHPLYLSWLALGGAAGLILPCGAGIEAQRVLQQLLGKHSGGPRRTRSGRRELLRTIPEGSRSASGALKGSRLGLCVLPGIYLPRRWVYRVILRLKSQKRRASPLTFSLPCAVQSSAPRPPLCRAHGRATRSQGPRKGSPRTPR